MAENQNIPIDQHYVPRSYMRNFSKIIGEGKKEKNHVCFFQFSGEFYRENVPTKSICYKHYFYGEDGILEKSLSVQESQWSKVLKKCCQMQRYDLNQNDESVIKEFAIYQFARTLASLNFTKDTAKDILAECVKAHFNIHIDSNIEKLLVDKVNESVAPSMLIDICNHILDDLNDLKITIYKFKTTHKLITSDAPVIITNPFSISSAGFANIGIFIMFPISPDTLVTIFDAKIYGKGSSFIESSNEQDVINLNNYQVISAEERIISDNRNNLEEVLKRDNALNVRKEYLSKDKLTVATDRVGTMFGAKSRSLPYKFELSFCSLPKKLRKIDSDCRGTYQRKYTEEAWIKSLIMIYRLPAMLKNDPNFTDEKIEHRKKEYSKMRTFLESYWDIPSNKRIITPELMKKIQSTQMQFFKV